MQNYKSPFPGIISDEVLNEMLQQTTRRNIELLLDRLERIHPDQYDQHDYGLHDPSWIETGQTGIQAPIQVQPGLMVKAKENGRAELTLFLEGQSKDDRGCLDYHAVQACLQQWIADQGGLRGILECYTDSKAMVQSIPDHRLVNQAFNPDRHNYQQFLQGLFPALTARELAEMSAGDWNGEDDPTLDQARSLLRHFLQTGIMSWPQANPSN